MTTTESSGPNQEPPGFWRDARLAQAQTGLPAWRQAAEAALLRLLPGRLGFSEYHDYRLHERHLSFADKRRFVGWRAAPGLDDANAPRWHVYADDKILLDALLAAAGLPRPAMRAVYRAIALPAPQCECFSFPEELADWLRNDAVYPLFAKPAHAGFGRGAVLIEAYSQGNDTLVLADREPMRVARFVAELPNPEARGIVFQELMRPDPALAELQCGRVSTLRMMTLLDGGSSPSLYRAVWKLPRRHNIVDNFERGSLGNLLGQIDLASGRVLRVIDGIGLEQRELDRDPDSGLPFEGLVLPGWPLVCDVMSRVAGLMPGFRFQHWDLALTDRGPVPLEIKLYASGGTDFSQIADRRGLLEPRLLQAVRDARAASHAAASSAKPAPRSAAVT